MVFLIESLILFANFVQGFYIVANTYNLILNQSSYSSSLCIQKYAIVIVSASLVKI